MVLFQPLKLDYLVCMHIFLLFLHKYYFQPRWFIPNSYIAGLHNDSSTVGSCLAGKAQLVVVIGAGGVGKALACGAKQKGSARIVIANHSFGKNLMF